MKFRPDEVYIRTTLGDMYKELMKKFLAIFTIFFFMLVGFCQSAFALEGIFSISSANFDTSNSIISLTSSNLAEKPNLADIKVVKLSNPTRIYFDIPNASLNAGKKDWQFSNSEGIRRVKISQFSTNPHIVRVVINYEDGYNIDKMQIYKLKNGVIIKFKDGIAQNPFMQNVYRDDRASLSDFYEYTTVTTPITDDAISQINSAFNTATNDLKQDLKLNTKYYIDKITTKNGAVIITGFGSVGIEKPMILSTPTRIVFDLPNTLVNPSMRNKEYVFAGTERVKLGQLSVNKARVVITTSDVTKYIPVYSKDNQTITFANTDKIGALGLENPNVNITGVSHYKIDSQSSAITLNFDKPIVHGFDRTNSEVVAYLYNVANFDEAKFNQVVEGTGFAKAGLQKKLHGVKLDIPIVHDSLVTTFVGADGKSLKIQIKAPKIEIEAPTVLTPPSSAQTELTPNIVAPKGTSGKHRVVIDAGHGGSDVGATRNGIYEKNITLDVAKRVEKLLKAQGYGVLMTRSDDTFVSLADRVAFSESYEPDIFVSIHVNSSTSEAGKGIETHYYHQESMPLAQSVHSSLASAISTNDRGLFKSKFYVINHTTAPAILVEIGFISNTAERGQLVTETRKQATAKAIVEGINNYFKSK